MSEKRSIVIIGGGISGLALAAYCKDGGFNSIILEKDQSPGGKLKTSTVDGFLLEHGANTTSSNLAFEELVNLVGLNEELIKPQSARTKRFIVKKNKLKEVSPKPKDILFTSLLSAKGKTELFKERFKKRRTEYTEETVGEFFERRFGKDVVDTLVDPFIAGIYAGDPYQLSMKSVMPKLLELEAKHGSITKAIKTEKDNFGKREIVTFRAGMQSLIDGLANYIGSDNILCNMDVGTVDHLENGQYAISLKQDGLDLEIVADVIVFATPALVTAKFLGRFSPELAELLELSHPNMVVLHLGYDRSAIKKPFEGFGFLIPKKENKAFLGAVANSSFLPNRAPQDKHLFTLFIGGTRDQQQLNTNKEELVTRAIQEFQELMKISSPPVFTHQVEWPKAIPQFTIGHQAMLEGLDFFEANMNNIHVLGSFRSGLSVADCVAGAKKAHGKLIKDYSKQSYLASIDQDYFDKQKQ